MKNYSTKPIIFQTQNLNHFKIFQMISRKYLLLLLILFSGLLAEAQNVGIGTTAPIQKLDVIGKIRSSTLTGVGNRLVMADPTGTLNASTTGLLDSVAWLTLGNSSIDSTKNFLGTLNFRPVIFKTNGNGATNERMRIMAEGQIVVNKTAPLAGDVFSVYGAGLAGALNPLGDFSINGYSANTGCGIYGENVGTGTGVFGNTSNGTGLLGIASGATAFGSRIYNSNSNGTALLASGNNLGATYLVTGSGASFRGNTFGTINFSNISSAAVSGSAVWGANRKTIITSFLGGAGVTGIDSALGSGVIGASYNGGNEGVYGLGSSSNGTGVFGTATAGASPYGVWGQVSTGATSIAVAGLNSSTGANAVGVLGQEVTAPNIATRYGVFANGDIGASGTKPFMIDHPLDPANKFLKHFSMESNEVLNYYRGNVILDANGEATVQLPNYFQSINNTNYGYNLTPIGQPASLYIKSEVSSTGEFVIAGGQPGLKVSWTLTAERNDPYLQQNPDKRLVEINKTGDAVGKYLQPTLFGQPQEMGIYYKKHKELKSTTEKSVTLDNEELKNMKKLNSEK